MKRIVFTVAVLLLTATPSAWTQATLASLKGTYTFHGSQLNEYSIAFSLNGQQVGFCNGPFNVVGYTCSTFYSFNTIAGTLVADGEGHITSGSFTVSGDPNSYECNPGNKPTTPCPVIVPSGNPYSLTEAYAVGATVDYTLGSVTRTFQAVRASTGKPPNWSSTADLPYICSQSPTYSNLNTCLWTHIPASLTAGPAITATFTGTYTIGANGSGVMDLTNVCSGCRPSQISFIAPPASVIGEAVSLVGIPTLANSFNFTGTAIRMK